MSVLVTRPEKDGANLCQQLQTLGVNYVHHPLLTIAQGQDFERLTQDLLDCDIVIAVSQYAVIWAQQSLTLQQQRFPHHLIYLAIGEKTAITLTKQLKAAPLKKETILITPKISDSEHLLALDILQHVKNKRILILRGNSGRELIYQQLQQRGAKVTYNHIYQRHFIPFEPQKQFELWQAEAINKLVITSSEQLHYLYQQAPDSQTAWLQNLTLYVPSSRIVQQAKRLGFMHIINTGSAANGVLISYLTSGNQ